ncbi:hypothetical protein M427DRAFT_146794 [Gonapodya prolifera JEL478]|uniref:Uncharacterized protein n=1 Tax=Gonapodya prolifera (strain JEL478) TaxID=1344416 RepID=A0A139A8M9_GONPJ|nr:hypothetical protein M427DRAFT_146794 [Gonapodya prolifera JEL478]|eukprot:KXS13064.1 hypothetical protein M427DRAFT_146794 [Gonapodya prolifera JEL478]
MVDGIPKNVFLLITSQTQGPNAEGTPPTTPEHAGYVSEWSADSPLRPGEGSVNQIEDTNLKRKRQDSDSSESGDVENDPPTSYLERLLASGTTFAELLSLGLRIPLGFARTPIDALLEFGVAVSFSRGPQNFIAKILNPGEAPVVIETSNVEEPGKEIDSKSTTSGSECASLGDGPTDDPDDCETVAAPPPSDGPAPSSQATVTVQIDKEHLLTSYFGPEISASAKTNSKQNLSLRIPRVKAKRSRKRTRCGVIQLKIHILRLIKTRSGAFLKQKNVSERSKMNPWGA